MKNLIKNTLVFCLGAVLAAGFVFPVSVVQASASFNNDSQDKTTLRVSNYTDYPNSTVNWYFSITADGGEVVSFLVYYHNTSRETAKQTKIKVNLPSDSFTSRSINASVWAENAGTAFGSSVVNLSSSQTLTLIPGTVRWCPNQMPCASDIVGQALPYGQSGSEIITSSGLNIGDIAPGWDTQGYVVFRAQVSNNNNQTNSTPEVRTNSATSINNDWVRLNGSVNPNGNNTESWFEWGETSSFGHITSQWSMGSGSNYTDYSSSIYNLNSNTTYYYRAAARNSYGTVYGNTLSFTTQRAQIVTPIYVNTQPQVVYRTTVVAETNPLILLIPAIDKNEPRPGDEITYTVVYKNLTSSPISNVVIKINLPYEVDYELASMIPTSHIDNNLTFNVGTVGAQSYGSISIKAIVKNTVKNDDTLIFGAFMDYNDSLSKAQTISAYLTVRAHEGTVSLGASLIDIIKWPFGYWLFDLLLILLIIFMIYWAFFRKKQNSPLDK